MGKDAQLIYFVVVDNLRAPLDQLLILVYPYVLLLLCRPNFSLILGCRYEGVVTIIAKWKTNKDQQKYLEKNTSSSTVDK